MKLNSNPLRGAALIALLVGVLPVISAPMGGRPGDETAKERTQQERQELHKRSANELTGMNVKSRSSGDSLGRVKDFVIDANSGQVVYAIIGSGGVLGIGETLHPVPVSALNYEATPGDERLTLDIDSARWAQAPRFKKDRLSSLQSDDEGKATFEFYGQTWQPSGLSLSIPGSARKSGEVASRQERHLVMSNNLIGKNIRSGDQKVGEIEDVLIQLQSRTAAVLLDPDKSFTGTNQKYIVPFNKFTLSGVDTINATLSRDDFASAQATRGDSWATQPASGGIYIYPGVGAADRVAEDMSRAGDKMSETGERVAQQNQPPVEEIRRVLQSDTTIAQQGGKNVQVIAEGNKVVLLGTVQTKEAKDQIGDRVEKAAPGWNIDNQLRVATVEE